MKIARPICLLSFFLVSAVSSVAQFIDHGILNSPTPLTPNAASILKFVDIPTNNYVGTSNISIPIFEIKGKNISLPISLTYQSFGYRVQEISSWCGTGWSLTGTGVIGRTIMDLPDNYDGGYLTAPSKEYFNQNPHPLTFGNPNVDSCQTTHPVFIEDVIDYYNRTNPQHPINGIDTEPDVFSFSTPTGPSGKFVFNQNGQIRLLPKTGTLVKPFFGSSLNDLWFGITDNSGIYYEFQNNQANRELVHTTTLCSNLTGSTPSLTTTPISSWFISSMRSLTSLEEISFSYTPEVTTVTETSENKAFEYLPQGGTSHTGELNAICNTTTVTYGVSPSAINFGAISVIFTTDSRLDLQGAKRLKQITVLHESDTIKKFRLYHSYWNDVASLRLDSIVESGSDGKKLPAYRFTYYSDYQIPYRDSYDQDHWGFFNAANNTTMLPSYQAPPIINFDGANKEPNFNAARSGVLQKVTYPTGGYTELEYEPQTYQVNDFEWNPHSITAFANAQSPIQSGGHVDYEEFTITEPTYVSVDAIYHCPTLEGGVTANCGVEIIGPNINNGNNTVLLNDCLNCFVLLDTINGGYGTYRIYARMPTLGSTVESVLGTISYKTRDNPIYEKQGGGIRIKTIRQFDGVASTPALVKTFEYKKENGNSSGRLMSDLVYHYDITFSNCGICDDVEDTNPYCNEGKKITHRVLKSSSIKQGATQGSSVGYDRVTEIRKSNTELADIGKTVFYYSNYPDEWQTTTIYPTVPSITNSYRNGLLLGQEDFNGQGEKIREIKNFMKSDVITEHDWIWGFQAVRGVNQQCRRCDFIFSKYHYISKPVEIDSLIESTYASSYAFTKYSKRKYDVVPASVYNDRFLLLRSTTSKDSKGKIFITENKYPYDFKSTSGVMDSLYKRNLFVPVLQVVRDINNLVFDAKISTYKRYLIAALPVFYPDRIFSLETTSPINYSQISSITDPRYPGTSFGLKQTIEYDSFGDVTWVKNADDIKTSFAWLADQSSPGRTPVVQVRNGSLDRLVCTSFESVVTNVTSVARTGKKAYTSTYQVRLPVAGTYNLTYWKKVGAGDWQLIQQIINADTTIGGSGAIIDEVRLYSIGAEVTTFTYNPIWGVTSVTDPNNSTTFYQYDSFGRLLLIKDDKGNILKSFNYHYKGH